MITNFHPFLVDRVILVVGGKKSRNTLLHAVHSFGLNLESRATMALRATIYKAEVSISDLNRGYFADHSLTLAMHPSETEERLMVRLLAFVLFASQDTQFGKGLSNEEDAAVWEVDPTGRILHWIDVGQPDETRLKKACGRSDSVTVLTYGRSADVWWKQNQPSLEKLPKVRVWQLSTEDSQNLASLAARQMRLSVTVQEDQVYLNELCVSLKSLQA